MDHRPGAELDAEDEEESSDESEVPEVNAGEVNQATALLGLELAGLQAVGDEQRHLSRTTEEIGQLKSRKAKLQAERDKAFAEVEEVEGQMAIDFKLRAQESLEDQEELANFEAGDLEEPSMVAPEVHPPALASVPGQAEESTIIPVDGPLKLGDVFLVEEETEKTEPLSETHQFLTTSLPREATTESDAVQRSLQALRHLGAGSHDTAQRWREILKAKEGEAQRKMEEETQRARRALEAAAPASVEQVSDIETPPIPEFKPNSSQVR